MLEARAHENQVYCVGVNRVGKDGNNISYSGNSFCFDAKGNELVDFPPHYEGIKTIPLSFDELTAFRQKFPVGLDADEFEIRN